MRSYRYGSQGYNDEYFPLQNEFRDSRPPYRSMSRKRAMYLVQCGVSVLRVVQFDGPPTEEGWANAPSSSLKDLYFLA